ncbi:acylphosphatase-2 isoform 2-T3 [Trichechus inunguis]
MEKPTSLPDPEGDIDFLSDPSRKLTVITLLGRPSKCKSLLEKYSEVRGSCSSWRNWQSCIGWNVPSLWVRTEASPDLRSRRSWRTQDQQVGEQCSCLQAVRIYESQDQQARPQFPGDAAAVDQETTLHLRHDMFPQGTGNSSMPVYSHQAVRNAPSIFYA